MTLPVPDLRPRIPPPPSGTERCGCCAGLSDETPQAIFNRDGLSRIAYRIGDHARFRASLHAALSSSDFAPLGELTARDDADFTIGLIDAFACAADVLTFYQERIANESFLRTATERLSLQEMGKLVGYRLQPGLAAETWLAFSLDVPPVPPPGADPGTFVSGVPEALRLDAGLKVQSVPGPDEVPQVFELVETLPEARAAWNAVRPWLSEALGPEAGATEAWLAGVATGLRPGDALLLATAEFLADPAAGAWAFRILAAVEPDPARDRTRVTWARELDATFPSGGSAAFALRRRAGAFGNNAPIWRSMDAGFREGYVAVFGGAAGDLEWPGLEISDLAATATGGAVDLDALLPDIAADAEADPAHRSFAVLAKGSFNRPDATLPEGTFVAPYRVAATTEVSRAEFAISAKVTRLEVEGADLDTEFFGQVRGTSVFAKSELLPLAPRPVTGAVAEDRIPVAIPADGLLSGRRLIVRGVGEADGLPVVLQTTLVAAHPVDALRCELEVDSSLLAPLRRDSVVVHANVALATHGETVTEILGSGSASRPFQRFELRQRPVTHRAAGTEAGARAEIILRVNDVAWTERPTLFGAAPVEHAYTLETDERGRTLAAFGDGVRGARLPTGVNNVRATYRKGLGAAGNVRAESLTQLMSRPLGLKGATNPLAAEGGADPEPPEAARERIPLTTRTLGRTVSLLDYEDFARAYVGIGKARAQVLQLSTGPIVAVTVAAADGAPMTAASPVCSRLLAALQDGGDPHVALALLPHQPTTFRLGLRVKRDAAHEAEAVLAAVEGALRSAFSFGARALGQPVHQSEVIAAAQAVPGVVAVDLTHLYGGSQPFAQTQPSVRLRLLAGRMRVAGGVPLPDELLTLDPAPFDLLEEMA